MNLKTIIMIAMFVVVVSSVVAGPLEKQDPDRKLALPGLLRAEEEPRAMIGLILEYSLYPRSIDVATQPGAPYKVASERVASSPGVYGPEIERRLLALLPAQIPHGDALATLGRATIDRSLDAVLDNAPPGAGGEGRLRTLMSLVELLGREHAEPILRRFYDQAHALTGQIEPFYDAAEQSFPGRDERIMPYWYGAAYIWSCASFAVSTAKELGSPIFIEDCLRIAERIRARPEDGFIEGFTTQLAFEYLMDYVTERPAIYTRVAAMTDAGENTAYNSAAVNVGLYAQMEAEKMRDRLVAAGKWPPPEQP